jgi:chaperonin GroEL
MALDDLCALTGARLLSPDAGNSLIRMTESDLGFSPRIVIGSRFLNVLASEQQAEAIDAQCRAIERLLETADGENEERLFRMRSARLRQQMAVIWISGPPGPDRDFRVDMAKKAASQFQSLCRGGSVLGAGSTLFQIASQLDTHSRSAGASGMAASACGLVAPTRWLARNAGLHPPTLIGQMQDAEPGHGLNIKSREFVELRGAGIVDSTSTIKTAVSVGLSMALLAHDCDAVVLRGISLSQAELNP